MDSTPACKSYGVYQNCFLGLFFFFNLRSLIYFSVCFRTFRQTDNMYLFLVY